MTPIFVRPVREQLEHDRLIRFLHARYKRKFDVVSNIGDQQLGALRLGANQYVPDMVLLSAKKLAGLIEIETAESTNNLEAMAQWTHFSHAKVPFHLYVPVLQFDAARRLCEANHVAVSEIWTYRAVNDQFDLVRMFSDPNAVKTGGKAALKATFHLIEPPKPEPPPPPPPPPPAPVAKPELMKKPGGKFIVVASPPKPVKPVAAPAPVPAKAVKPVVPAKPAKPAPAAKAPQVANPAKAAKAAKPAKATKAAKPAKVAKKVAPAKARAAAKAKSPAKAARPMKAKATAKKRK